jgi:hypothetical protein
MARSDEDLTRWDEVCDLRNGSVVCADGELVSRDGTFLRDMTGV